MELSEKKPFINKVKKRNHRHRKEAKERNTSPVKKETLSHADLISLMGMDRDVYKRSRGSWRVK